MMMLDIRKDSGVPVFRQIMDQLVCWIDTGTLKNGSRLPSTRELADRLGLNRSTVYRAYQELWALGYIDSRPGSYSIVRQRTGVAAGQNRHKTGMIDWASVSVPEESLFNDLATQPAFSERRSSTPEVIDFLQLAPDPRLFPADEFRKCVNTVLLRKGSKLLDYGEPWGYAPLRAYVAQHMRQHCVNVSADEILITRGSQNAIELIFKLLVTRDRQVAVEAPTYSSVLPLFRFYQVKPVGIPMGPEGMDLTALDKAATSRRLALVYTMPNFHNPTGITTSQAHRERLLALCEHHCIPLVEDGFEEELKYFGKGVLPIKSMDRSQVVLYLGTFSKVLFPGLRIGWVAADRECIKRLVMLKHIAELSSNMVDQAALDLFCRRGLYDHHVKRIHRIFRRRMQTALKAIKACFPGDQVSWTRPAGGYTIWIQLKHPPRSPDELADFFLNHGVRVWPGHIHFHETPRDCYFRLSIARLNRKEIITGIRRFGNALAVLYA